MSHATAASSFLQAGYMLQVLSMLRVDAASTHHLGTPQVAPLPPPMSFGYELSHHGKQGIPLLIGRLRFSYRKICPLVRLTSYLNYLHGSISNDQSKHATLLPPESSSRLAV
ncbi:hypothetical protein BX600DRAFT_231470 [Xylariales sp. PMI_506]|nr:hypothetical protein BX600DRAFT_231470 [Xylariales sp. PMI_506]